ncbi:putative protein kinase RLK-Pelle-DLSV family [Helianthus annuus]|nr:putative protein kinase RLK-Pelle-DLSV family [Helianthus annuus]KAJ0745914.1 putative protein kinase RLK-Pelle-DLSV family [Helianthus annuus]KAJ0748900.1 putative protein kinase RLK-Pelle-DLSV family [Helianthus annuus]
MVEPYLSITSKDQVYPSRLSFDQNIFQMLSKSNRRMVDLVNLQHKSGHRLYQTEYRQSTDTSAPTNFNSEEELVSRDKLQEDVFRHESCELPIFEFKQIIGATDHFSHRNKLGEGGFGEVYKGMLDDGQQIAVKRLRLSGNSGQGIEEFKNEIMLISKLQHRNLVKLLGCCIEGGERLLIYEYMTNKSLDTFLFGQSDLTSFSCPLSNIINLFAFDPYVDCMN